MAVQELHNFEAEGHTVVRGPELDAFAAGGRSFGFAQGAPAGTGPSIAPTSGPTLAMGG